MAGSAWQYEAAWRTLFCELDSGRYSSWDVKLGVGECRQTSGNALVHSFPQIMWLEGREFQVGNSLAGPMRCD